MKYYWTIEIAGNFQKCMIFIYLYFAFLTPFSLSVRFFWSSFLYSQCGAAKLRKLNLVSQWKLEQKGMFRVYIAYITSFQFPVYQGHVTEEATENFPQNLRKWNIHCKYVVTFKSLLLYISCRKIFFNN